MVTTWYIFLFAVHPINHMSLAQGFFKVGLGAGL